MLKAYYVFEDTKDALKKISILERDADDAAKNYTDKDSAARAAEDEYNRYNTYASRLAVQSERKKAIRNLREKLEKAGEDFRMLVLPDHPTPIRLRTHTSENVPYMLYDSTAKQENVWNYNEKEALQSGNLEPVGHKLIDKFLQL